MSRAQEIADKILASERYAQTRAFSDRIFHDEPILRTGAQAFAQRSAPAPAAPAVESRLSRARTPMPSVYRKMRALARTQNSSNWGNAYTARGSKLFYEQGKLMEDFEDDFDGQTEFKRYFPTYDEMSDYELRCYFSWRSRLRKGEWPSAPVSFLFVYTYEILCGIGVTPGNEGYRALCSFADAYAGASTAFDTHLRRWKHDYVVFHGLDASLVSPLQGSFPVESVALLKSCERILIESGCATWPGEQGSGLPGSEDLLDALCVLSRYRAERSRFVKAHKEDAAEVAANVFARMVAHCHKRRKTDYVEGLFGPSVRTAYTMFPSALFWSPEVHADVSYVVNDYESYACERGFWWRNLPCRRMDTSRELGNLLHAIDCRMRLVTDDAHPLKERSLPKYQGKFIDEEIAAFLERNRAREAAQIHIDRTSLRGIRQAHERTREALLTDDERADDVEVLAADNVQVEAEVTTEPEALEEANADSAPESAEAVPHADIVRALVNGEPLPSIDSLQLSLAIDEINEAFLDIVGDVVIELDGDIPILVEDYIDDVCDVL